MTNEAYVSIQRWAYVAGPTPGQTLRNLADYMDRAFDNDVDEAINGLDDNIVPIMLCRDESCEEGDPDCYRAGLCVSWTPERTDG